MTTPPGNYPPPPGGNYPPPGGNYPPPGGNYPPPPGDGPIDRPRGYYPIDVVFDQPQRSSRLLAGLSIPFFMARYILLIPAFICLYVVSIIAAFAAWFACWAVLFTGHYPDGLYRFVAGTLRWTTRAQAYLYGLTDRYPPFGFAP